MSTIISWTDETWNPTTGCSKVDGDCKNCYAERISAKFAASWGMTFRTWSRQNAAGNVSLHPERLDKPRKIKTPSRIFVDSMSDLFHEMVPDEFIAQVFGVMEECPQHTFQILTKRPERAAAWRGPWTPNVWMGTSVGHRAALHRVDEIRRCRAKTLFLSLEPLWERLGMIDLDQIDWVIVGGESGPGYRPMPHAWAREIRDQCVRCEIPFWFKQSAGPRTEMGVELEEEDGSKSLWRQFRVRRWLTQS